MGSEFYIGYLEKAPSGIAKHMMVLVVLLALLMILLAWILASQQRGFARSTYQYTQETFLTGVLTADPVPALHLYLGNSMDDVPVIQVIPLVQFGKRGGAGLIQRWQDQVDTWVTLKGYLIFYDGKALMDIADPVRGISPAQPPQDFSWQNFSNLQYDQINTTLVGEIVDAKCFFGVMKPGYGKPHRSCAIRCISGGIPAVLKVRDKMDHIGYYLIEPGNINLALYIGEAVEVTGGLGRIGDWETLSVKQEADIKPLGMLLGPEQPLVLSMCN